MVPSVTLNVSTTVPKAFVAGLTWTLTVAELGRTFGGMAGIVRTKFVFGTMVVSEEVTTTLVAFRIESTSLMV